jgi:outer membrane protein
MRGAKRKHETVAVDVFFQPFKVGGGKRTIMKKFFALSFTAVILHATAFAASTNVSSSDSSRLLRPLSIADALDIALQQNGAIRKSRADLEATHGVIVQTRAIAWPKLRVASDYSANEESSIDRFRVKGAGATNSLFTDAFEFADQRWSANIRVVQSIYEGGKITSAFRSARLTREQAFLAHQTVIADVMRDVRIAYYGVLVAQQQIAVQEASLRLLEQELADTQRRFQAGTVPRFNVLRAEVEVANSKPKLIRARNALRTGKDNLANLLGENVPAETQELSLQLTDKLEATALDLPLSEALAKALEQRTELAALRKVEALRDEDVKNAKAGYKPSVQIFAGYGTRSSQFSRDLTDELHGWEAGAQLNWNIFDGFLTKGRVEEARAVRRKAGEELADAERRVALEVRVAYSAFVEAQEVLRSQEKVQESAEEALRLANARAAAGTATQLDVLNAQTALTEARTTQVQALHDYAVARARLERAIGPAMIEPKKP